MEALQTSVERAGRPTQTRTGSMNLTILSLPPERPHGVPSLDDELQSQLETEIFLRGVTDPSVLRVLEMEEFVDSKTRYSQKRARLSPYGPANHEVTENFSPL
jgi:hypothetical protein